MGNGPKEVRIGSCGRDEKILNFTVVCGAELYCSTLTDIKSYYLISWGRGGGEVWQLGKHVFKVSIGKDNLKILRITKLE